MFTRYSSHFLSVKLYSYFLTTVFFAIAISICNINIAYAESSQSIIKNQSQVTQEPSNSVKDSKEETSKITLKEETDKTTLKEETDKTTLKEETDKTTLKEETDKTTLKEETSKITLKEETDKTTLKEETDKTTLKEDNKELYSKPILLAPSLINPVPVSNLKQYSLLNYFINATLGILAGGSIGLLDSLIVYQASPVDTDNLVIFSIFGAGLGFGTSIIFSYLENKFNYTANSFFLSFIGYQYLGIVLGAFTGLMAGTLIYYIANTNFKIVPNTVAYGSLVGSIVGTIFFLVFDKHIDFFRNKITKNISMISSKDKLALQFTYTW